jgi:predicted permease
MSGSSGGFAVRLYELTLCAFPRRLRRDYGAEMVAAFAASHAAARSDGAGEARRYTWRASLDAIAAGLRERLGGSGVGAEPPRTPAGRAWSHGRDAVWRELGSDLRFAFRTLRHEPGFALTMIAILALGVGVNGAIFTAVDAAVLAPLPYPQPDELVLLDYTAATLDAPNEQRAMAWSWPKYRILADAELPLDGLAAYAVSSVSVTGRGNAARLQAEPITDQYFAVLDVPLRLGRPFAADEAETAPLEVILSNGLWRERFGGDTGVLGRQLTVNGHAMSIVGVAPPGFRGLSGQAELWVPVPAIGTLVSPVRLRPAVHWLQAIGRTADGVTPELLDGRMAAAAAAVDQAIPLGEAGMVVGGAARSMSEARRNPRAQQAVMVIAGAAGLVLLIGCVNVAALMLARGGERRREIAVRLALGGSRARVARGLACESLLLALAGGLLGSAVAATTIRTVAAMWPASFRGGGWNLAFVDPGAFAFDATTFAYTMALGLLAGVLFGAGPALRLSRADLGGALKEGGKSGTARGSLLLRRGLVAAEIAAALVLLVGATLMLGSLARLLEIDTGFQEDNLLVFEYSLPRESVWADNPAAFHDELFARLRALPQVVSAAGGLAPLRGYHLSIVGVTRAGAQVFEEGARKPAGIQAITDDYFATLQTPVVRGRAFDGRDQAGGTPAMIINETAARELFGDLDPIGEPIAVTYGPTADGTPAEVIGVVADVLYDTREKGVMAEAYFLQRQNPEPDLQAIVRTRSAPYDALPAVRAALAGVDPDIALYGATTAEELAAGQVADTRVIMQLLAVFATLAVLLAATGIWGVVSYSVVQRRRELGIRMALGARAGQAMGLILRRGLVNALVGVAAGTVAALALSRYLESLLYEIDATDPAAFTAAATFLFVVALLAAWLPALRATRVDPTETLRSE